MTLEIKGRPSWLSVSPLSLNLQPGQSEQINLNFNSESIPGGNYDYILNLKTNDFHFPNIEIPILLNIESLPCNGAIIGDLNQDQVWNVLDVILMINIILSGTNDECEFYLSDLNSDETINVLDVVFLINLILDE